MGFHEQVNANKLRGTLPTEVGDLIALTYLSVLAPTVVPQHEFFPFSDFIGLFRGSSGFFPPKFLKCGPPPGIGAPDRVLVTENGFGCGIGVCLVEICQITA